MMIFRSRQWRFLVRFGMVGVLNTALDTAVFLVLAVHGGWPVWLANLAAWSIAVQQSYMLNGVWTFGRPWPALLDHRTYAGFLGGGLLGLTVGTVVVTVAAAHMPVFLAKMLAILCNVAVNYLASHLVFHTRLKRIVGEGTEMTTAR